MCKGVGEKEGANGAFIPQSLQLSHLHFGNGPEVKKGAKHQSHKSRTEQLRTLILEGSEWGRVIRRS